MLKPRLEGFKDFQHTFGRPNTASRKSFDSGTVTLRDGSVMSVPPDLKEVALGISKKFDIDEVEALVLLRSFIYNVGLPDLKPGGSLVEDIIEGFTPFYYAERRCLFRILVTLLRANESNVLFFHDPSTRLLPEIISQPTTFVLGVLSEIKERIHSSPPDDISGDPRMSSAWAKELVRDHLVFLELLFWLMWSYVPREGEVVLQIFSTGYGTNLGSAQQNGSLLLDEEGTRLQQDCAGLWTLLMISILELEAIAVDGTVEVSDNPTDEHVYFSSPASLRKIHELVVSNEDTYFAPIYASWVLVLWRLETTVAALQECPSSYRPFFESLDPHPARPYFTHREPVYKSMLERCLDPDVGLFNLLLAFLTTTPLFSTSIAWQSNSAITDPNSVAYRSVMKGEYLVLFRIFVH